MVLLFVGSSSERRPSPSFVTVCEHCYLRHVVPKHLNDCLLSFPSLTGWLQTHPDIHTLLKPIATSTSSKTSYKGRHNSTVESAIEQKTVRMIYPMLYLTTTTLHSTTNTRQSRLHSDANIHTRSSYTNPELMWPIVYTSTRSVRAQEDTACGRLGKTL